MWQLLPALPLMLLLSACDGTGSEEGSSVLIQTNNSSGHPVRASVDGETGKVALNLPGFKSEIDLPRFQLDASNLSLNGAGLYPGSTIRDLSIVGGGGGDKAPDGDVAIAFDSPAGIDAVRQWFATEMRMAGFILSREGGALVGRDGAGEPVRIDFSAAGADHTEGRLRIGG